MTLLLALLFTLVAPGAGHLLVGDYAQGVLLGMLFALGKSAFLPLALRVFKVSTVKQTLQFLYVCNWGYIALILYALCSVVWKSFLTQEMHILVAFVGALCIMLVYKRTQNKIIFTALCGRSQVYELVQKMRKSPSENK